MLWVPAALMSVFGVLVFQGQGAHPKAMLGMLAVLGLFFVKSLDADAVYFCAVCFLVFLLLTLISTASAPPACPGSGTRLPSPRGGGRCGRCCHSAAAFVCT